VVFQLVGIEMVPATPWICDEEEGGSARDAVWRKAPCERAAAASPFSGSTGQQQEAALFQVVLCNIQVVLVSLSLKTQVKCKPLKRPERANCRGPKRVLCFCYLGCGIVVVAKWRRLTKLTCKVSVFCRLE
jgi:hypothetical protein